MKLRSRGYELIQNRPFNHNEYIIIVTLNELNDLVRLRVDCHMPLVFIGPLVDNDADSLVVID